MKLNIVPEQIIPARFEVVFGEDSQTEDFLVCHGRETELRKDIADWLDARAPGWSVVIDRGGWGEGTARVTVSLPGEDSARAFHARWNTGLCDDESAGPHCQHMSRVAVDRFECDRCGARLTAMNPSVLPRWNGLNDSAGT